ncbi:MAG: alanine dehydrogenase [Pseudomonadota bacterium]
MAVKNVGVLKEVKDSEYRVGIVPSIARDLVARGLTVFVEKNAGTAIGITDEDYLRAGAEIVSADKIYAECELIVKVKEPQPEECKQLHKGQTLFTFLHLARDPLQAKLLIESGCTAIAYETVTDSSGGLPIIGAMSEISGRLSVKIAAMHLEKPYGGPGILLSGVPGVSAASVIIIGAGVSGTNALRVAVGLGARVTVLDTVIARLRLLDSQFGSYINTVFSTQDAIERYVKDADVVIGAVLVPGASTPKLITRAMVKGMKPGSVIVDMSIDQGGCSETSRVTRLSAPTYVEEGVTHYCVDNMGACVARTATYALNHTTMPFIIRLAEMGVREACLAEPHLLHGLNIHNGQVTHAGVAESLGYTYVAPEKALG